ncbi:MAG: Ig-like domain-containing protein, partial [Elusimicrobia bacterium]|nr:Ig-like domain-containing protein [Elusimicrobiota bacterium]
MDEAGGTTLVDELGSANAVLTGGRTTGVRGGGIAPDAVGSIAVDPVDLNTPAWTIMGWFRIDAARGDTGATLWGNLYDGYTFYDPLGWTVCHVAQDSAMLDTNQGGFYVTSPAAAGLTVDDGAWHHAAQVYGGGVLKLYVDGVYLGGENRPATLGGTSRLNFGNGGPRQGGYGKFVGDLDEFAMLDRALSQTELLAVKAQVTLSTAASAPTLAAITVTPATTSIAAGAAIQFEAAGAFTDLSTRAMTGEVVWTTDLSSVATVNAGLATGVGGGTAQVIASSGAITGYATLTVTPPSVTLASIAVTPATATLLAGATAQFSAVGTFTDGSTRALVSGTGAWQSKAPMSTARLGAPGAFEAGKFFVFGGFNGASLTSTEAYDPLTDAWTLRAAQPVGRTYAQAAAAGGKIYVAGGCVNADCASVTNALWMYDPAADAWTQKASMPTARFQLAFEAIGGKLYAAGGLVAVYSATAALEVYDPATNAWETKASMPLARGMAAAG